MVSYYNSTNMYRHQQGVAAPANAPMHTWYAGYHQTGQMAPDQQMWEQQMWHHHPHVPTPHSVFANNEFSDFVHSGHGDAVHGQLMASPTVTVSGSSEMSSPGAGGNISPQNQTQATRPPPARSPYEWIKKTSYQSQPNPGKTRTKDKYRVVYSDHQKHELEREFTFNNKYITIRRKSELAANLGLSERQIKIWFQNRRAKERKQNKKRIEEKNQMDGLYQHNLMQQSEGQVMVGIQPANSVMMHLMNNNQLKTESDSDNIIDNVV